MTARPANPHQARLLRLAALAEAPYAFGTTLAQWQGEGDRPDRWRARLATPGSRRPTYPRSPAAAVAASKTFTPAPAPAPSWPSKWTACWRPD
ncbi:hypothetical protein JGS22_024025 [Streptomyces sp. P38-E01]|uniref:Uncharacterized protein n=1 Tax=Streptomyces tardus TaxID=2780544 RepID=A0A949JKX4_9ACTN|nr:hypothetical protein [Streptomyces tardus]MBU7600615.1 hypothetical protein [Streptomyces tardus]